MPHLVAGLVVGARVRVALLGAIGGDVADGAEPDHLTGLAQGDMLRLRLAQTAGEREMGLVVHRLLGKAEEGVGVDRFADRLQRLLGQLRRQVDSGHPGTEGSVQRLDVEAVHAVSPNLFESCLTTGAITMILCDAPSDRARCHRFAICTPVRCSW